MHELIILGFLQDGESNGYTLKQQVDKYLAGVYAVNYGSLYPKFKKLESLKCVVSRPVLSDGGQQKVYYEITGSGKELFKEKMLEYPKEAFSSALARFKVKLLFFNYVDEKTCYDIVLKATNLITKEYEYIESYLKDNEALDEYRSSLLKHNLALLKSDLAWLKSINY
ncbi:MAG: PadR family transcriptional regulator [Vampirovibrionia bacterium]